jgi:hypothetical protein
MRLMAETFRETMSWGLRPSDSTDLGHGYRHATDDAREI